MPDLLVPDVSEYQSVDFAVFSGPIIVRAHNGTRVDRHWSQHAQGASKQPWWAAYQYLPANTDPAVAARGFLTALRGWRPDCTILDLEEGDGNQQYRQHAWLSVMADDPAVDWTYSGDYFARSRGVTVDWVAAYGQREPTTAHRLWQFTDKQPVAGIGTVDCSVFHGTIEDLRALTGAAPRPQPANEEDDLRSYLVRSKESPKVYLVRGDHSSKWHVPNEARVADLVYRHRTVQPFLMSETVEVWEGPDLLDAIPTLA